MDSISATLVFAPILAPVAINHYGIDPIHFGIVFVVNMEIGYIAPPVATNLFVAAAIFRQPFIDVAKAIVPTLTIICAALVVLIYVPTISKGPINLREGDPFYESFPWAGKVEAPVVPTPAEAPVEADPGRPLTMEEMMKKARANAAADDAAPVEAPAPAAPGRPLTMEEMMKKAKEDAAKETPE
jgi:C4-dicarboxylate transporter DctM subunit